VLSRPASVTDPLGNVTQYTYDANGNLLTVKDAKNHTTSYGYNSTDQVSSFTDALGHTATESYDLAGNLTSYTSRGGQQTTLSYDPLNRLTKVSYGVTSSGSQSTTSYSYDAGNRLTAITDSAAGPITFGYDGLGSLTGETTPQGSVAYTYDAAGNRSTMTVAGQPQASYSYDSDGRLTTIAQGGTTQVSFGYDGDGRPSSITLPGGVSEAYGYDAASQLTSIGYTASGTTLGNLTYGYDADGRQVATGGSFARVLLPAATTFATYNAMDQLPSLNGTTLSYDANGNLTSDGTNSYTWNARGQLTGVSGPSQSASFAYNGLGQRTSATVNGSTTGYLYDGANVVQELSGSTPTANLLSGAADQHFTATTAGGTSDFLTDRQGSAIALTDSSGNPQTQYTYDPYGNPASSGTASTNAFQFTGQQKDGTGLYYYRSRYYSPALSRFLSEDPAGQSTGPNPYLYANDDPVNLTDPSGMSPTLIDTPGTGASPLSGRKIGSAAIVLPVIAAAVVVIAAAAPEEAAAAAAIAADTALTDAAATTADAAAADGITTFYRGTTYGSALEVVQDQAFDVGRIMQNQALMPPASGPGVYMTTQETTANYYANLAGGGGRGMGPGVIRIEAPTSGWNALASKYGLQFETPVPQPPFPGQTETILPFQIVDEFNQLAKFFLQ
jgi:RHS repeat-associated protein